MDNASSESSLEVLLNSSQIAARIRELGEEISADYYGRTPHLVGVLKGAWIFMADLIRNLSVEATVDFLGIQSYVTGTTSSGEVKITKDLDVSIAGRDVLVVEDILDTGRTYHYLQGVLSAHQPKSLKLVSLLDKTGRRVVPVKADYVGFPIPDVFVVGYGLDYNQQFRRLPEVRCLRSVACV
ncbi:MAG TPA: hypoxanthine phosphoribosyltransferase [Terriglobia bacterium]|nr:hypoxanthine phosphoribosyltransferase [Terriglobia bacterium]